MTHHAFETEKITRRVRAILLSEGGNVLFIKRIKPAVPPYWVAPGGGVEEGDDDLQQTLARELMEELGARADVLYEAFVLRHEKAGKNLEEHFYVCRLIDYDLSLRHGPEFSDPARGLYLPDFVSLTPEGIARINIKTEALSDWLLAHAAKLRGMCA